MNTRRGRIFLSILFAIFVAVSFYCFLENKIDLAIFVLTVAILCLGILTLFSTFPKEAKLEVTHLDELETNDLIFYFYPETINESPKEVPIDYLLQLHVAVSNVGGRKAILSKVNLEGFVTNTGRIVHLPDTTPTHEGVRWQRRSGWMNGSRYSENLTTPPPYVIDTDEAVIIRFRTRRGIGWGENWDLDRLKKYAENLQEPIISGFGTVTWRRAGKIVRERFDVEMNVLQQAEYVHLIKELTQEFNSLPEIPEKTIDIE